MTDIALYNALRKIPELSDAEAKEAAADVANSRDIATKDYIDAAIAKQDAKIERMARLIIMWVVGVGVAIIGVIIGAIKYL